MGLKKSLLTLQLGKDGMSLWIDFLVEENKAVVLLLDYVVQHLGIHLKILVFQIEFEMIEKRLVRDQINLPFKSPTTFIKVAFLTNKSSTDKANDLDILTRSNVII